MDDNVLVVIVGIILSIVFNWSPKLKDWYTKLDDNLQRMIMLALLVASVFVLYALSCTGYSLPGVTVTLSCDAEGQRDLIQLFINALVANQVSFLALPKPKKS